MAVAHLLWRSVYPYPAKECAPCSNRCGHRSAGPGARRLPLAAAVLLVLGTTAHAATIAVNAGYGRAMSPGSVPCAMAIQSANEQSAPADTNCVAGSGADDIVQVPFASISLSQGTLAPTGTVLIEGAVEGSRTTVMRPADAPAFPIFSVPSGNLTVQRLQISGGRADFRRLWRWRWHQRHFNNADACGQCSQRQFVRHRWRRRRHLQFRRVSPD